MENSEYAYKEKLLTFILISAAFLALASLIMTAALHLFDFPSARQDFMRILWIDLAAFIGIGVIYLIKKFGNLKTANILILALLIIIAATIDIPENIISGRSGYVFLVPIILSSVLLISWAAFLTYGVTAAIMIAMTISENLLLNPFTMLGFFMITLISWVSAKILEETIQKLSAANHELIHAHNNLENLVEQRTDDLVELNQKLTVEIAKHKETEKQLTRTNAMLTALLNAVNVGIMTIQGTSVTWVNDKMSQLTGYSKMELETTDYSEVKGVSIVDHSVPFIDVLKGKVKRELIELEFIHKNGEKKYISSYGTIADIEGTPTAVVANVDVTEIKKADKALKESEERYRYLVTNMNEALVMTDDQFNITFCNMKTLDFTGYTENEILGMPATQLFDEENLNIVIDNMRKRREGKSGSYEVEILRKDQTQIPFLVSGIPIFSNGEFKGSFVVATDLTQLAETKKELESAKNLAEAANHAKTEFLANMSHELRTPMQGVIGFAKLGIDRIDKLDREKVQTYFREIYTNGKRLLALLNNLLDLSKLEAGKMEYQFGQGDLTQLTKTVLDEMTPLVQEKSIHIDFQSPADIPGVKMDTAAIKQVILNFISNALRYSPEAGSIRLRLQENEATIQFTIQDEGIGIPEQELNSIFEKFVQSSKTKSPAGGTGLGLAICKQIISDHHGEIWAESNPDIGAMFGFTLPKA